MDYSTPPVKTGLLQFLKTSIGGQFVIPVYQRNYAWSTKEVTQYFNDICGILEGKYKKHFLGILIYLTTEIDYKSREMSVIDGQQRLTTTFLILYAVRDLLINNGEHAEADVLTNQILINQYASDNMKFKLKPLVSDDEIYKEIVNGNFKDVMPCKSNIYLNYVVIKNKLEELVKKYSINEILMALDKLYVVCIPVAKEDNAQKIFESINSTGAKLMASDLIRNFMLMEMTSDSQDKFYVSYWKKLEANISSEPKKLESFFRMFLATQNKTLSNANSIYNDFKVWHKEKMLTHDIEEIFKILVRYSRYYNNIYIKNITDLPVELHGSLVEYRRISSDLPAPLLMEIYFMCEEMDDDGNQIVSYKEFAEIIEIINTYLLRRAICGLDTSDITRMFPVFLRDIINDMSIDSSRILDYVKKTIVNKQRGKSTYMPTDEELLTRLEYLNVYSFRSTLRIIFDKLEHFANTAPVDLSKLNIEHIMPQSPTKEWLEELNVDDKTYELNLHRLGNLTLASKRDNSKMSNNIWEYKKEILADTAHLIMNQSILSKEKWGVEEISLRTIELIDKIIMLYPYVIASDDVIKKYDIMISRENTHIEGILYEDDGSVEILQGSYCSELADVTKHAEWHTELFNNLLEEEIIKVENETVVFLKSYTFYARVVNSSALSNSASFLLLQSRSGWESWTDKSGTQLNQINGLKQLIQKKNK